MQKAQGGQHPGFPSPVVYVAQRGEEGVTCLFVGIVNLRGIPLIDPQHTRVTTGLEPIILGGGQPSFR